MPDQEEPPLHDYQLTEFAGSSHCRMKGAKEYDESGPYPYA
jgi:hypothetical protein